MGKVVELSHSVRVCHLCARTHIVPAAPATYIETIPFEERYCPECFSEQLEVEVSEDN